MNIVFMGSPSFALPSLEAVNQFAQEKGHALQAVFTQPDRPKGRGQKLLAVPVALRAKELSLPLYQPKSLKKGDEAEEALQYLKTNTPDVILVVAYGLFLPDDLLEIPRYGCINVHPSLLPAYRGPAPIPWAIANGEKETGVTTMNITNEMDAGPILLQEKCSIGADETMEELELRLAQLGGRLLVETLQGVSSRDLKPKPQPEEGVTFCRLLKKEDGKIDWNRKGEEIYNQIRGFNPRPGTFTTLSGELFKIHQAMLTEEKMDQKPGTVTGEKEMGVITGDGFVLSLKIVQLPGGKKQVIEEFLHGHSLEEGIILGA